jgi:hypothetical protein
VESVADTRYASGKLAECDLVLSWRVSELSRAGYGDEAVVLLATAPDVDLHLAVDLIARGCPVETAVRILL